MEFINNPVLVEELPRAEDVTFTPIDTAYLRVLRLEWLVSVLALLIAAGVLIAFVEWLQKPLAIILLATGWIVCATAWYFLRYKSFPIRGYALREKDILYRAGWIIRDTHICPFNRIQHITVKVGPLDRRFGFATLVLYTAAANEGDLYIHGLHEAEAWKLKEWITQKITDEPITPGEQMEHAPATSEGGPANQPA